MANTLLLATLFLRLFNYQFSLKSSIPLSDVSLTQHVNADIPIDLNGSIQRALLTGLAALPKDSVCSKSIKDTYIDTKDTSDLNQLILFSSKNKNDLLTYSACMRQINNTYIITRIEQSSTLADLHLELSNFVLGLCVSMNVSCAHQEFIDIIYAINADYNNYFNVSSKSNIQVTYVNKSEEFAFKGYYLFNYIPFIIIILLLIANIFSFLPYRLILWCHRVKIPHQDNNENKDNDNVNPKPNDTQPLYSINQFHELQTAFSLSYNIKEVLNFQATKSCIHNESGLLYIRGLEGICLVFLSIGAVFSVLWKSPAHIYSLNMFDEIVRSFNFGIVFFSLRYSPRILFSCSGFVLIFKFLCFLDEKAELNQFLINQTQSKAPIRIDNDKEKEKEEEEVIKAEASVKEDHLIPLPSKQENVNQVSLSFKYLAIFILYQLHKYLITIFIVFFVRFNLYQLQYLLGEITSIWHYFYQIAIRLDIGDTILQLFLQCTCLNTLFFNTDLKFEEHILEFFWMANNEILFFALTSVIVFLLYKTKEQLLIKVVFGIFICFIVLKVILVFSLPHFYPTVYFATDHYGKLFRNPIYNYPYYLIGVLFGLFNYVLQKGMLVDDAGSGTKNHFSIPIAIIKKLNAIPYLYVNMIFWSVMVVLTLFILSQPLMFLAYNKSELEALISNKFLRFFYVIDVEIIVIALHLALFSMFMKKDSNIVEMVTSEVWSITHKLYYSFILILYPVILYFLHQSETRIMLTISNLFLFSIIIIVLTFGCAFVVYVLIELPFKRFIHFKCHLTVKSNDANINYSVQRENGPEIEIHDKFDYDE